MKLFRLMREGREEVYTYFASRRCIHRQCHRQLAVFCSGVVLSLSLTAPQEGVPPVLEAS